MGMLTNRLRTITGENAGVLKSFSRLFYYTFRTNKLSKIVSKLIKRLRGKTDYQSFLKEENAVIAEAEMHTQMNAFVNPPNIAIVLKGGDITKARRTLGSIQEQRYQRVQCFVSNNMLAQTFDQPGVKGLAELEAYDLVFFVNVGTLLDSKCLFYIAQSFSQSVVPPRVIYVNHDHIKETGERYAPCFKPGWSPDLFWVQNYIQQAFIAPSLLLETDLQQEDATTAIRVVLSRQTLNRKEVVAINTILLSEPVIPSEEKPVAEPLLTMRADELISIVIPTRNKTDLVKQCIRSIVELSTYKHYEIVLVNNRSDDAAFFAYTAEMLSNPNVRFKCVDADIEFNFSTLINLGVTNSDGAYILLLNNDVKVITPDWMQLMLSKASQEHVGGVGVKLLYPNETIQHAGIVLSQEAVCEHVFVGKQQDEEVYANALNTTRNYLALTAACLMVSKAKFLEVSGFEEQFKVEYNDIDFCLKLYERGYYNVYLPQVKLFHYESASRRHPHSDKKSFGVHLSETQFMREKWAGYLAHDPFHIFRHSNNS